MNKRILNIVVIFLCLVLFIFPVIFSYESAYAYTLPSENPFGLSAEEARKIVNEHDVIYGSNKEPYFVYMNDVKAWKCITDISAFDTQLTDDQVVDILSSVNTFQYAVTAGQFLNVSSQIFKGLGYLTGGVTDAFLNLLKSNGGELTKGMTYDENNGITILSDTVDKLREEIKKQYYDSIGVGVSKPVNTPQFALGKLSSLYEYQEDYISDYNNIKGEKYVFGYIGGNGSDNILLRLNFTDSPDYFYYDSKGKLCAIDSNLSTLYDFTTTVYAYSVYSNYDFMGASSSLFEYRLSYGECGYLGLDFKRSSNNMFFCVPLYYYSDVNTPLWFFKSYEALYNYVHGSQTAYLSSKVEQTGEDIKISVDDMNTNISDKMDELIDSINNKKDGMSADELQKAIDKGLESLNGKMDDIKDNTQETNSKLDNLLSVMQSQNEILMNILGVTTDIYNIVSSTNKEDGTNYTISDLQPHFNKCFTAVKNMVLYGVSSFDDVGAQSVMSVDNDVGEIILSDDVEDYVKDYHNGLLGKFPFSVPYQLYEWLQVLQAEPWILGNVTRIPRHELPQTLDFSDFLPLFT